MNFHFGHFFKGEQFIANFISDFLQFGIGIAFSGKCDDSTEYIAKFIVDSGSTNSLGELATVFGLIHFAPQFIPDGAHISVFLFYSNIDN